MKHSRQDFAEQRKNHTLRIAFVGMSNIGKSRLAKDLAKKGGFTRVDIDAKIGERLALEDIRSIAGWLGFPASDHYAEREQEYLRFEDEEMQRALSDVGSLPGDVVLDTTGSVVYVSRPTLHALRSQFLIVHVGASHADVDELFTTFQAHPKPVIWHGMYSEAPQGSDFFDITTYDAQVQKNLEHSYRSLLADRLMRYTLLADVTINRFALYKAKTVDDMLTVIEKSL